jgi:hypothetical protein
MPSRGFHLALILPMLGLVAAPAWAQFCHLDHASRDGRGIALHFVPGSNLFVRISKAAEKVVVTDRIYRQQGDQMHRSRPNAQHPDAEVSEVVVFPGEEAFVSNGLHSSCIILPSKAGDPAGVTMQTTASLPGLPSSTTTRFLPVGTHQEAGH